MADEIEEALEILAKARWHLYRAMAMLVASLIFFFTGFILFLAAK